MIYGHGPVLYAADPIVSDCGSPLCLCFSRQAFPLIQNDGMREALDLK